jgi:hypothetical protein
MSAFEGVYTSMHFEYGVVETHSPAEAEKIANSIERSASDPSVSFHSTFFSPKFQVL